jgi:hypothetical protein
MADLFDPDEDTPTFEPAFYILLGDPRFNPLGRRVHHDDVKAWIRYVWNVRGMRLRGYRLIRKAIRSWWGRVREGDVEEARKWAERVDLTLRREAREEEPEPAADADLMARIDSAFE